MFGGLAAKLQAKKAQQQQTASAAAPAAPVYTSASQLQQEAHLKQQQQELENANIKKRQRDEDAAADANGLTTSNHQQGNVPPATSTTDTTTPASKATHAFLELDDFLRIRDDVVHEARELMCLDKPSSTNEHAAASTLPMIPRRTVSVILSSGGLRSGLRPLRRLSDCLATGDDAFVEDISDGGQAPQLDASLASIVDDLARRSSWSLPSLAEGGDSKHDRSAKRILAARWLWSSLLHWRVSIVMACATHQVHSGEADKLSSEEVRRFGHRIAEQREALREYAKAQGGVMRLICALFVDATSNAATGTGGAKLASNATAAAATTILPDAITDGLYDVAHFAEASQYESSEGAYFQAVIGSEKWRLGLYSAGDMHMRHALEKTQRDRVRHLLNNETAMVSLHAVKRMITLHQGGWVVVK